MPLRSGRLYSSSLGTSFPADDPLQLPKASGNWKRSIHDPSPLSVKRRKLDTNTLHCNQTKKRKVEPLQQVEHLRSKAQKSITAKCRFSKGAPLTEKNLRAHSRSMPRSKKLPTIPSLKSRTTTTTTVTTDKRFGKQLAKNCIFYDRLKTQEAVDAVEVRNFLNRARDSNSPDEQDFKEYIRAVEYGKNERSLQSNAWHILAKRPGLACPPGYAADYDFSWTEVDSRLTSGISKAKPDISESYREGQYSIEAQEALGSAICPTQYDGAMPTFCVEWKGPEGSMPVAEKQCAYDGALMTEAALEVHLYMQRDKAEFYNRTQALTVAINGESVHLYGCHVVQSIEAETRQPKPFKKSKPVPHKMRWKPNNAAFSPYPLTNLQYHHFRLDEHVPERSLAAFKETRKQIRNAQDWARQRATRTKDELNAYVKEQRYAYIEQDSTDATATSSDSLIEDNVEVSGEQEEEEEEEEEVRLQAVISAITPPSTNANSRDKTTRKRKLHKIK